ncbi:MAG: hypothetical protein KDB71_07060 [Mycobacterium sp.]|nr:hypothetical protein [Mycobacterium sp.]
MSDTTDTSQPAAPGPDDAGFWLPVDSSLDPAETHGTVVNLDQPDPLPALERWKQLVEEFEEVLALYHNGNAGHVMPGPRPVWADEGEDQVLNSMSGHCYRSAVVRVPASNGRGLNDGTYLDQASVDVSIGIFGVGNTFVSLTVRKQNTAGKWVEWGHVLTAAEAVEVSKVLLAAVDLLGGAK